MRQDVLISFSVTLYNVDIFSSSNLKDLAYIP